MCQEYAHHSASGSLAYVIRDVVERTSKSFKCTVVVPGDSDLIIRDGDVVVIRIGLPRSISHPDVITYAHLAAYFTLTRLPYALNVCEHRVHLVHAHEWIGGLIALPISRALGVPLVLSLYSTEYERFGDSSLESLSVIDYESLLVRSADLVLCHKESTCNVIRSRYGRDDVVRALSADDVVNAYKLALNKLTSQTFGQSPSVMGYEGCASVVGVP